MKSDVAVIGAGPSGAWTAYLLARGGARVLLIDPSHPREKPCGGGVTGRALAVVSQAVARGAFPAVQIRTARFVDTSVPGRDRDVTVALPSEGLVVASRADFDGALLAAATSAGAEHVPARVRHLSRGPLGYAVTTETGQTYRADRVVGADGANSFVRRTVAAAFRREQLSIATGFYARGVTSDEVVLELSATPPGYFWSFPRPDHLAIGICAQADAGIGAGALRQRAAEWIRRSRLACHAPLDPYAWPIPSLSSADFGRLSLAGDDWFLVGDAAGLVDPITREGIYFALESARYAAESLLTDSSGASRRYIDRVQTEMAAELAQAARLKAFFYRPAFTGLLFSALTESDRIRAVMADLVAGTQGYRTLKWRLAATMQLGLACRLLRLMRS